MKVASFYRFLDVSDTERFRDELQDLCEQRELLGTVLIATEGFNGTLAGSEDAVRAVLSSMQRRFGIAEELDARWTSAKEAPFRRMRVRVKREIVTLGRPDILPHRKTGRHVPPARWNELIENPDVLVVDTRNHYEYEVGTFPGAVDPGSDSFREFPVFANKLAEASRDRTLAMFCTGGIRCEKASALMLDLGFRDVYQLQGGILNYLESVPADQNRWDGECFVFDTRVAVDRDLSEGGYVQCHACRRPLSSGDLASPDYEEGVSCPRCVNETDTDRRSRLLERRKQILLAAERGESHIGPKTEPGSLHAGVERSKKTGC